MIFPDIETTVSAEEFTLIHSAVHEDDFANSFPDTAEYFEDWLQALETTSPPAEPAVSPSTAPREIRFEGTLKVEGYVAGSVQSEAGTLITTEAAEIDGDVLVDTAIIYGLVRGDIRANTRVELGHTARVIGDILGPALSIQPGAVFEGRCSFLRAGAVVDFEDEDGFVPAQLLVPYQE